ncbi:MAG: hypothetical protein Q7R95_01555 [bacterium]|nr:hypothetical protein [bacterium]
MKKIVLILMFLVILFKPIFIVSAQEDTPKAMFRMFLNLISYGQSGGPDPSSDLPLPGVNCGVANNPDANPLASVDNFMMSRCCNTEQALINANKKNGIEALLGLDKIKQEPGKGWLFDFGDAVFGNIPLLGGLYSFWQSSLSDMKDRYVSLTEFSKLNQNTTCVYGEPDKPVSDPTCICKANGPSTVIRPIAKMCYLYLSNAKNNELGSCVSCASSGGIWTAIGCVPTNFQSFVSDFLLSIGIGLGGVVALLCIIYSAFMMQTSQGNPEKIKKAQENLTSCILGLMLIIFSVFIMRIIGVDILRIPFLSK